MLLSHLSLHYLCVQVVLVEYLLEAQEALAPLEAWAQALLEDFLAPLVPSPQYSLALRLEDQQLVH